MPTQQRVAFDPAAQARLLVDAAAERQIPAFRVASPAWREFAALSGGTAGWECGRTEGPPAYNGIRRRDERVAGRLSNHRGTGRGEGSSGLAFDFLADTQQCIATEGWLLQGRCKPVSAYCRSVTKATWRKGPWFSRSRPFEIGVAKG